MAGRRGETGAEDGASPVAGEPITLTDPDGAVTLVAPWASWTREQVRAPGGEPALVTRLDQGQLWFSAGRRRSPWRHEVHIGDVVVSTPAGRFHVTAEPDGGATVECLAGRTRIASGLHEAVVLDAGETAAVASDARTVVLLDRESAEAVEGGAPADRRAELAPARAAVGIFDGAAGSALAAAVVRADAAGATGDDGTHPAPDGPALVEPATDPASAGDGGDDEGGAAPVGSDLPGALPLLARPAWRRIPELVAVAALVGVLLAAVIVFGRSTADELTTAPPSTLDRPTTTDAPSTTAASTTSTAPTTTTPASTPSTTAAPQAVTPTGTAGGELTRCRRAPDGAVLATVLVTLTSGGAGRFKVDVGLVDRAGQVFARGEASSGLVEAGAPATVDVPVKVDGPVSGSCELLSVTAL